jgi:hypothetical protein
MAADLVEHLGVHDFQAAPQWHLAVRSLVERLLAEVDDPALRDMLAAASLVRVFDEPTLAALSGHEDTSRGFDALCRLSFVRAGDRGLMLHEVVRQLVLADLQWRHPDRYRELWLRRQAYYRERSRTALREEREWLVAQRLALWGEEFDQFLLSGPTESADYWVTPAPDGDTAELHDIFETWLKVFVCAEVPLDFSAVPLEMMRPFTEAVLTHPHARVRVARDESGQAVGFSNAVAITKSSYELLGPNPIVGPVLQAYLTARDVAQLPDRAEDARLYQILQLAYVDEAVRPVLARDLFGIFALGATYVVALPLPSWKVVFESLGFQRLEKAQHSVWTGDVPTDGYVLDLRGIGVEAWLDTLMTGRPLLQPAHHSDVSRALHEVLRSWTNDDTLSSSPLIQLLDVDPAGGGSSRAAGLRQRVAGTLATLKETATDEELRDLGALESGYLSREGSLESLAERFHVSRATLFRMLSRAESRLAGSLLPEGLPIIEDR